GAAQVTLGDALDGAVSTIKPNIATVEHPKTHVVHAKAKTFLATAPKRHYTMVLADPHYELADDAVADMLAALIPALAQDAVVVIESNSKSPETALPEGFELTVQKVKKRTFGIARVDMAIWRC